MTITYRDLVRIHKKLVSDFQLTIKNVFESLDMLHANYIQFPICTTNNTLYFSPVEADISVLETVDEIQDSYTLYENPFNLIFFSRESSGHHWTFTEKSLNNAYELVINTILLDLGEYPLQYYHQMFEYPDENHTYMLLVDSYRSLAVLFQFPQFFVWYYSLYDKYNDFIRKCVKNDESKTHPAWTYASMIKEDGSKERRRYLSLSKILSLEHLVSELLQHNIDLIPNNLKYIPKIFERSNLKLLSFSQYILQRGVDVY